MRMLLAVALLCSTAYGQIEVPAESEDRSPIRATVKVPQMPKGAIFEGGWSISNNARFLPVEEGIIDIWADPGSHLVGFKGFWLLLKTVTFKDGDGNEVVIQSYLGHGFIDEESVFTVLGGDGPDPPKPPGPDPIEPGQKYQIVFFIKADDLDKMPIGQRDLVNSLIVRQELSVLGHRVLQVIDDDQIRAGVPAKWKPYVDAVMGDPLPRVAIAPIDGGAVIDFKMPANFNALLKELEDE